MAVEAADSVKPRGAGDTPAADAPVRPKGDQVAAGPGVTQNSGGPRSDTTPRDTVERVVPLRNAEGAIIGARFRGPTPAAPGTVTNTQRPAATTPTVRPGGPTEAAVNAALNVDPKAAAALSAADQAAIEQLTSTHRAPGADALITHGLTAGEIRVPNNREEALRILTQQRLEDFKKLRERSPELAHDLEESYRRRHNGTLDGYDRFQEVFAHAVAAAEVAANRIPEKGDGFVRAGTFNGAAMAARVQDLARYAFLHGAPPQDIRWMRDVFSIVTDPNKTPAQRREALRTISEHAQTLGMAIDVNNGQFAADYRNRDEYRSAFRARQEDMRRGFKEAGVPLTEARVPGERDFVPDFNTYRRTRDRAVLETIQGRSSVSFRSADGRLYTPSQDRLRTWAQGNVATASVRRDWAASDPTMTFTGPSFGDRGGPGYFAAGDPAFASTSRRMQQEEERLADLARARGAATVRETTQDIVLAGVQHDTAQQQVARNRARSASNLGLRTDAEAETLFGRG